MINKIFEKQRINEILMLFAILINENEIGLLNNKTNKIYCDYLLIKNC
jgi:hypothetical protein